ncbi:MAG: thiamine/thiamine pyrophosphate ABC transporter permease ThiP [Gemmobacter sp.]
MARGAGALGRAVPAVVAALVAAVVLGTLGVVALQAWAVPRLGTADHAALRFTLMQAALSAGLSVALAVPVARALARRRFVGRGAFLALLGAPFLLPGLVAVLGLLAVYGRGGWVNAGLAAAGLPGFSPYGAQGVILAHVFLNLPLAVRMILTGWAAVPGERFRLAAALGFTPAAVWRHIEMPMLRAVLPGAMLAVFLICLTSFAVALTMGGGPRATTVELAIYQAIRFEFDLPRAAALAAAQAALCAAAALAAGALAAPSGLAGGLDRVTERWDAASPRLRALDAAVLVAAGVFLAAPLGAVMLRGLGGLAVMPDAVWPAALRSLAMAIPAALLGVAAALALAIGAARARWVEVAGMLPLAASPLVLGTGLFLVVFPLVDPAAVALPVAALVNAMLALPFALRLLLPALREVATTDGRLAAALGLPAAVRLRRVILPRLRRPLGLALGLSAALAAGDLGAIALFAREGGETLPLLMQRLMGAYRMEAAAGVALVLAGLAFALFAACDTWGRHADA